MIHYSAEQEPAQKTQAPVPAIEFQAVSKSFGSVQALKEVSLTIPQGQATFSPNCNSLIALKP